MRKYMCNLNLCFSNIYLEHFVLNVYSFRVIYKLLASKSEGIRVQALKAMGYFLKHLPPKRKAEVMLGHGLFSLLAERLMLQTNLITMTTYNVLFEVGL